MCTQCNKYCPCCGQPIPNQNPWGPNTPGWNVPFIKPYIGDVPDLNKMYCGGQSHGQAAQLQAVGSQSLPSN